MACFWIFGDERRRLEHNGSRCQPLSNKLRAENSHVNIMWITVREKRDLFHSIRATIVEDAHSLFVIHIWTEFWRRISGIVEFAETTSNQTNGVNCPLLAELASRLSSVMQRHRVRGRLHQIGGLSDADWHQQTFETLVGGARENEC